MNFYFALSALIVASAHGLSIQDIRGLFGNDDRTDPCQGLTQLKADIMAKGFELQDEICTGLPCKMTNGHFFNFFQRTIDKIAAQHCPSANPSDICEQLSFVNGDVSNLLGLLAKSPEQKRFKTEALKSSESLLEGFKRKMDC